MKGVHKSPPPQKKSLYTLNLFTFLIWQREVGLTGVKKMLPSRTQYGL